MQNFLLLLIFFLTGCVTLITPNVIDPSDSIAVQQNTTAEYNEHKKLTWFKAPEIREKSSTYLLRALVLDTGHSIYQIYIFNSFDDWAFIDTAYSNGKKWG